MIYFDTAYLLKCYVREPGWEAVRDLARRQLETIFRQLDLDEPQRLLSWLPLTDSVIAEVILALRTLHCGDRRCESPCPRDERPSAFPGPKWLCGEVGEFILSPVENLLAIYDAMAE